MGPLAPVEESVTANQYKEWSLNPVMKNLYPDGSGVFQDDTGMGPGTSGHERSLNSLMSMKKMWRNKQWTFDLTDITDVTEIHYISFFSKSFS